MKRPTGQACNLSGRPKIGAYMAGNIKCKHFFVAALSLLAGTALQAKNSDVGGCEPFGCDPAPKVAPEMAGDGRRWRRWPEMAGDGRRWPEMAGNGRKWQEIGADCSVSRRPNGQPRRDPSHRGCRGHKTEYRRGRCRGLKRGAAMRDKADVRQLAVFGSIGRMEG